MNHIEHEIHPDTYAKLTSNLTRAPFDLISTLGHRLTGTIVLDVVVAGYGDKGTGKSEGCLYIAERLSHWLAKKNKGKPSDYFTMDNVRAVDPDGTLKMFTSHQLIERKNQILVIDDASISANARDFYKEGNKRLNAIITVARIYRHCVILNTISSNLIDTVLRQFSDYVLEFQGPDEYTETNQIKVFAVSSKSLKTRSKDPYHKYLQYYDYDKRLCQIRSMIIGRPSLKIREEYGAIRKEKTDALVMKVFNSDNKDIVEEPDKMTKTDKRKVAIFKKYKPIIAKIVAEEPAIPIKGILRHPLLKGELSEGRINQILGSIKLDKAVKIIDGKEDK